MTAAGVTSNGSAGTRATWWKGETSRSPAGCLEQPADRVELGRAQGDDDY